MKIIALRTVAILAVGTATLWAADSWQKKDFTQWGQKEIRKLLTDSPWSQSVRIKSGYVPSMGTGAPLGRVSEQSVTRSGGQAAGSASGGAAARRGGGSGNVGRRVGSTDRLPPRTQVLIRWVSALPVKRAMVKQRFGEKPIGPEGLEYLGHEESHYRISILGLPRQLVPNPEEAGALDDLKKSILLKRKNKNDILAETIDVQPRQRLVVIYARFPRTDAVTLDDKNVELVVNLKSTKVKRKFKLKEMVFEGQLEL